ncbi:MAG: AAA family ATPase [Promethearchaeota archaeon]
MTIGPAGCGKSTFQKKNYSSYHLISPDLVRFKILDSENTKVYFDYEYEAEVWEEVYKQYEEALDKGVDIFFDGTNLTQKYRYPIVCRALRRSYFIHMVYFKVSLETALKRNGQRERKVREEVIERQYEILEPPEEWEYDKLTIIT